MIRFRRSKYFEIYKTALHAVISNPQFGADKAGPAEAIAKMVDEISLAAFNQFKKTNAAIEKKDIEEIMPEPFSNLWPLDKNISDGQ